MSNANESAYPIPGIGGEAREKALAAIAKATL